jgi:hypothetical protein
MKTIKTTKIEKIEKFNYNGTVHNVELQTLDKDNDDLFWVCNNVIVHNCFPKDLNSLIFLSKQLNVKPLVIESAWEKNLEVRKEKDWEGMVGRAVSKKVRN